MNWEDIIMDLSVATVIASSIAAFASLISVAERFFKDVKNTKTNREAEKEEHEKNRRAEKEEHKELKDVIKVMENAQMENKGKIDNIAKNGVDINLVLNSIIALAGENAKQAETITKLQNEAKDLQKEVKRLQKENSFMKGKYQSQNKTYEEDLEL